MHSTAVSPRYNIVLQSNFKPYTACIQVHGHDFSCLASIPSPSAERYLFASGSEEKVLRVFEAPAAFLTTLASARGREPPADGSGTAAAHGVGRPFKTLLRPCASHVSGHKSDLTKF